MTDAGQECAKSEDCPPPPCHSEARVGVAIGPGPVVHGGSLSLLGTRTLVLANTNRAGPAARHASESPGTLPSGIRRAQEGVVSE